MKLNENKNNLNKTQVLLIEELEKNNNIPEFLILLLKEHCKINNIYDNKIEIDNQYSSSRISGINIQNINNNNIIINEYYYDVFIRTKRDCDM